jgi:hypothetical protein
MSRLLLVLGSVVLVAACSGGATPAPSANPTTNPTPSPVAGGLTLRAAPANLGCDTMQVSYSSVTFHIDPAAADQVTATTPDGKTLQTYWSGGFTGDAEAKLIKDSKGAVVAADGDELAIPQGAFPRLHGYFVCPSTDAIYVLEQDPA